MLLNCAGIFSDTLYTIQFCVYFSATINDSPIAIWWCNIVSGSTRVCWSYFRAYSTPHLCWQWGRLTKKQSGLMRAAKIAFRPVHWNRLPRAEKHLSRFVTNRKRIERKRTSSTINKLQRLIRFTYYPEGWIIARSILYLARRNSVGRDFIYIILQYEPGSTTKTQTYLCSNRRTAINSIFISYNARNPCKYSL